MNKKLSYPLFVKLIDSFRSTDDYPFIVRELANGGSLDEDFQERFGPLKILNPYKADEALDILFQMSLSLDFLHSFKIVYRHLRPTKVLIFKLQSGFKLYKLADFGFAKEFDK